MQSCAKLRAKHAAAAAKRQAATAREKDSSDDEKEKDSSDEEGAHVRPSAGKKQKRASPGELDPPPPPPGPPALSQTKLPAGLKLCELAVDAPQVTAAAVGPPLEAATAATRFVFVPASQFEAVGIGGWIARIHKVAKGQQQATEVRFKDADNKSSTHHFAFAHVKATFKPLN